MEHLIIREACMHALDDINGIVKLCSDLFKEDGGTRDPYMNVNWPLEHGVEHFANLITRNGKVCFVAYIDNQIMGYLAGYVRDRSDINLTKSAVLESMFVDKRFRSQEIGSKLVNRFMEWLKKAGAMKVTVTAYASNKKAIAFY
jgi:ribosomal protein S18 acetylase RimI-like enzyme